MSSVAVASTVFACVFGAAMLGLLVRAALPAHHLSTETKDTVKLAMGLVATMTALILGLLVASAKGSYDTQRDETTRMGAKIAFLDVLLEHYGPDTTATRERLRTAVGRMADRLWSGDSSQPSRPDPSATGGDVLFDSIQKLAPQNESQGAIRAQALAAVVEIGQMRWLLYEQAGTAISMPLLVVVVVWLAIIFLSFGLFAPPNATAVLALMVAALSVSGAIFLIMELDHPFDGMIQISSAPMRSVLGPVAQ